MRGLSAFNGAILLVALALPSVASAADDYQLGPDSERQPGVPQGKVTPFPWKSNVFAGTERDCWLYVPAQYDGSQPAAVMVFQDGAARTSTTRASFACRSYSTT